MTWLIRKLVRAVIDSELVLAVAEREAWKARAEHAEDSLHVIAALRMGSTLERTATGFTAHAITENGSRHTGHGLTPADAIRASGVI